MSQILVIGSLNTDMVIQTEKIPSPEENITWNRFFYESLRERRQSGNSWIMVMLI